MSSQSIWEAAYAAAFVSSFEHMKRIINSADAARAVLEHVKYAESIANLAVQGLKEREKNK